MGADIHTDCSGGFCWKWHQFSWKSWFHKFLINKRITNNFIFLFFFLVWPNVSFHEPKLTPHSSFRMKRFDIHCDAASFNMQMNHWVDKPGGPVFKCVCLPCILNTNKIKLDNYLHFIWHRALHRYTAFLHMSDFHISVWKPCRLRNKASRRKDLNKSFVFVPLQFETEGPEATDISHAHVFGDEASAVQSGSWWKAFVSKIDCVTALHMPNGPAENDSRVIVERPESRWHDLAHTLSQRQSYHIKTGCMKLWGKDFVDLKELGEKIDVIIISVH